MGASSPAQSAADKKPVLTILRLGRPNDILLTPSTVLTSYSLFMRAHCQRKTVDINVLFGYPVFFCAPDYPPRDLEASFHRVGDALLVDGKTHYGGAVFRRYRQYGGEGGLVSVDGVYYGFAVVCPQRALDGVGFGAVYLKG